MTSNIIGRLLVLVSVAASAAAMAQPVGASRPTLAGVTSKAEAVDLQRLRGKVVLLFFWSTECPVCLDKMPELRRNLEGWRGKDFVIVAVNQDRAMADLKNYEKVLDTMVPAQPQMKLVWRRDPAHRDSFGELPLNSPTSVIVDREGAVVKQIRGRVAPELWNDIAELVLN